MKVKSWLIGWLIIVITALSVLGFWVYRIDPYFHYHKPDLNRYFYPLNNQRSQNDGICKHFDYEALITGTSMTENFRTSEMDKIFGCNSIKVSFSGGSYKEINDNIERALKTNKNLKIILRGLDIGRFFDASDCMREDLGKYPTFLYDNNIFNDVEYLFNRDIIFGRAYQLTLNNNNEDFNSGITSFDDYSRWQSGFAFGINSVYPDGVIVDKMKGGDVHLTNEEKAIIKENIDKNVTSLADKFQDVDFYYFYTPYSIAWWCDLYNHNELTRQIEAERYITELILPHNNIHLFSFNNRTDITTDLNNYKDTLHYATWINSLMLKWMHEGKYQITQNNYNEYLQKEYDFYSNYDYLSLNGQVDYEADYYAAALLNKELTGVGPMDVLNDDTVSVELMNAEYAISDNKVIGIDCKGSLKRDASSEKISDYMRDIEYVGAKFVLNMDGNNNYLSFYGQKIADHGRLTAYVYNENNEVIRTVEKNYTDLDNEKHQYVIDLSDVDGNVTVILNGGYIDNTGSANSKYVFSDIFLY